MLETLQAALAGNAFFSGGLLLGALGMLAMWLRNIPGKIATWARQFFVVTLNFDSRDELMFTTLVEYMNALEHRVARELNRVAIYIPSPYTNEWMRARLGNHRRLDSIVLKTGQTEAILADLNQFFSSRLRYEDLGIPWRRGYLLHGPPGTGKTSLVTALASEMALNVCTLSLASPSVTDEKIGNLLSSVPPRSVILIEDIDAFFRARDKVDAQVKVSYSGFINALDGVAAHEGSVVFLTTNHPELIDEAAIRSGRVDFRLELGLCDRHQFYWMFRKFFDDDTAARHFADSLPEGHFAPATLQERLLKASDVNAALAAFGLTA